MANQNQKGIKRIWNAMLYSISGLKATWNHEAAFRQEVILCMVLLPSALLVGSTATEKIILICSCLLVLITELLNSAIEATIDRISEDRHILSERAKDMGSAAVFISLWVAGISWTLIIFENYF